MDRRRGAVELSVAPRLGVTGDSPHALLLALCQKSLENGPEAAFSSWETTHKDPWLESTVPHLR